jgi:fatty acid desaturase
MRGLRDVWRRVEGPTWLIAGAVYGGWALVTWYETALPQPLVIALLAWLIAWHGSLQHEVIHGHPAGSRRLAALLAAPPLALWLPFAIYRATHLRHHNDTRLTDPYDDPESFYAARERWLGLPRWARRLLVFNQLLLGRLLVGPAIVFVTFFARETAALRGPRSKRRRRLWARHLVGVALVLAWALLLCNVPLSVYLAAVYGGTSLLLLRSYYEHRAARSQEARTAIVEAVFPFGLLFLFNNLHAAHHAQPRLPWYELPRFYSANRATLLAGNGGFHFAGYRALFRRYLFRPNYIPIHPTRHRARSAPIAARPRIG